MIKAVVFDLDGTLLNTLEALSYCISLTMEHFGLKSIDKEHTRYFGGEGARKFVDRALIYNGDKKLKLADKAYKVYCCIVQQVTGGCGEKYLYNYRRGSF